MKKILAAWMLFVLAFAPILWAEEMKTYFPSGKVQMEISDNGMKTYYENGQIMNQIDYKNGEPAGVGKSYYEDGKIMREDDYEKKSWKQYAPEGHLAAEGKM